MEGEREREGEKSENNTDLLVEGSGIPLFAWPVLPLCRPWIGQRRSCYGRLDHLHRRPSLCGERSWEKLRKQACSVNTRCRLV